MHTRTQFLSIPLPTVALAALLRSFANRSAAVMPLLAAAQEDTVVRAFPPPPLQYLQ